MLDRPPPSSPPTAAAKAKRRARQARYEARRRAGIVLATVPLTPSEIDALVRLRWLPMGAEDHRERVGAAATAALRSILR